MLRRERTFDDAKMDLTQRIRQQGHSSEDVRRRFGLPLIDRRHSGLRKLGVRRRAKSALAGDWPLALSPTTHVAAAEAAAAPLVTNSMSDL